MLKLRGGCITAATTLVAVLLIVLVWGYLNSPSYLDSIPATESICGAWIMDSDLTTGYEGTRMLQADHQHNGCLEVKPNGRFTIKVMPRFWEHPVSSDEPSSASGTWRWESDNNGWIMLNLCFEQVGDKKAGQWDWGHSYIRHARSGYFLYFIRDFDSSDFVVLRKSQ